MFERKRACSFLACPEHPPQAKLSEQRPRLAVSTTIQQGIEARYRIFHRSTAMKRCRGKAFRCVVSGRLIFRQTRWWTEWAPQWTFMPVSPSLCCSFRAKPPPIQSRGLDGTATSRKRVLSSGKLIVSKSSLLSGIQYPDEEISTQTL